MCVTQWCPTLRDPTDCSPPGSAVHGIPQARVLGWVATSFSRGPCAPGDGTQACCVAGRSSPSEPAGKPKGKCRSSASGNRQLTMRRLCDVVTAGNGRIPAPSKGPVAAQQQEILYRKRGSHAARTSSA